MKRLLATLLATSLISGAGWAQEAGVWLQVEARPTLSQAQDRARAYAGRFDRVAGHALASGWYGIALGPYDPAEARRLLAELTAAGAIPGDAFIADGEDYRARFWPVGARTAAPVAAAPAQTAPAPAAPGPAGTPPETLAQSRASEAALDRAGRERLQRALAWAGVYDAAIDGAIGAGTRAAMAEWQRRNGAEPTGVLSTAQRAALLAAYDAVIADLGLETVRDERAGIAIELPLAVVARGEVAPPFVHYEPSGDLDAKVLLISRPGDARRLAGLYEILQTLEIVPPEGPRGIDDERFVIEGTGDDRVTHVEAALIDGAIKGFALVWPAGDEARRARLLARMTDSFAALPGALEPAAIPAAAPDDSLAGLRIRTPLRERAGVFLDEAGTVATAAEAVEGCEELSIEGVRGAELVMRDAASGLALLRPAGPLAPRGVARLRETAPREGDRIAVAGFPYGGALPVAAATFGRLAGTTGPGGEADLRRLDVVVQPGDIGGPVLDMSGAVLGLLLPGDRQPGRVLPEGVALALGAPDLRAAASAAGIEPRPAPPPAALGVEAVARHAGEITALVGCWD